MRRATISSSFDHPWRYKAEKWLWVAMIPVALYTGLAHSVTFVSFLSLYALVLTLSGAEMAAKATKAAAED